MKHTQYIRPVLDVSLILITALASWGCPLDVHKARRETDFLPHFWEWHPMETGNYSKHFLILKYLEIT